MKRQAMKVAGTAFLGMFCLGSVTADTVTLKDGSRLEGDFIKAEGGKLYFKTGFAGTLEIPQDQVASLLSDDTMNIRTDSGEVYRGRVMSTETGAITVDSPSGRMEADVTAIASAWQEGARDPIEIANERKWVFEAGVNITGSDGNTERLGTGLSFDALLEGADDRLHFYLTYLYSEEDGEASEDEQVAGVSYTNFFTPRLGWYVRTEGERDVFEGIKYRSTSGAGLSYKFVTQDRFKLEGRLGASYRFEDYTNDLLDSEGFPGLDSGLMLRWQFADWGKLATDLTYTPSVNDFGDYIVEHQSTIDIPLKASDAWYLRFGVSNKYNSSPEEGREELDTTYFLRLLMLWD